MNDKLWFNDFVKSKDFDFIQNRPIVYFCAEYALTDSLSIYAGGLGVLAGDIIREAKEQKVPLVAVGLFYRRGYSLKKSVQADPKSCGLVPVTDAQNNRIIIKIPIQNDYVSAGAWLYKAGSVSVYLLDTNIDENSEENRQITEWLYPSDKEIRFKQEMLLGIGGSRLLDALNISPIAYHLNEGHSALLALEITKRNMRINKLQFDEELKNTRRRIFFTNHTLVPAGNDTFSVELVSKLLKGFAGEMQLPVGEIIKQGVISKSGIFSMALLALKMAGKINAVSRLHAKKAQQIWVDYPMIPITNGIHIKTWDLILRDENIWEKHLRNKHALFEFIYKKTGKLLDENVLLIGWARRIVRYKRPLALFEHLMQFKKLAETADKPIKVVISGIAHQKDAEGLAILKRLESIVKNELRDIVVYLPNYNLETAEKLVSGCDLWLNTPEVGFEACGTSGMKAALNGVLPCSTNDGWIAEANLNNVGWLLADKKISEDILSVLKNDIVPLFFERDMNGIPQKWVEMMRNARKMTLNQFSSTKMLRKYFEEFYLPFIRTQS